MKAEFFAFYPQAFIAGTMAMTAEEVGGYIRLLCFQWEHGSVPDDDRRLASIGGISIDAAAFIRHKFGICQNGGLKNARMESVRDRIVNYRNLQKNKAEKRWSKTNLDAAASSRHMPNECRTDAGAMHARTGAYSLSPSKEGEEERAGRGKRAERQKWQKPSLSDFTAYGVSLSPSYPAEEGENLYDHYESNGWKVGGKTPMVDWRAAVRKAHRQWCREHPEHTEPEAPLELMAQLQPVTTQLSPASGLMAMMKEEPKPQDAPEFSY